MFESLPPILGELRSLYEDLHANPELSFQEHRTSALLADGLAGLGYDVTTGVGYTGVVATLANGEGPTVMLRADIDALPVQEKTGLPYASTVRATDAQRVDVPVMHACGHDMHATWLIGAATLLAATRSAWSGTVVLVVQPAEEVLAGAAAMISDDLFERFGVPDVVLGQHVTPAPAGTVAYRSGPVMSASDSLSIVLHGRGAHGSTPEQSVDPVVMAASTVMRLQTVVSRELGADEAAVVTVGTLHAGTKENIIADRADLALSVRTYDPQVRERVLAAITRIVQGEAQAAGAPREPEIAMTISGPAVTNDADATAQVANAFVAHFGAERAAEGPRTPASEDFGLYGDRSGAPSVFWFVGGTDPTLYARALAEGRVAEDVAFNHSPHFAPVQDPTIATGVEAMVVAALGWLAT